MNFLLMVLVNHVKCGICLSCFAASFMTVTLYLSLKEREKDFLSE